MSGEEDSDEHDRETLKDSNEVEDSRQRGQAEKKTVRAPPGGKDSVELEWRDWVALSIAFLETVLLPMVVIIVVVAVIAILFTLHP